MNSLRVDFSAPIKEIQDLCNLASKVAGSEIALVSLVGESEQRFAANIGLDGVSATARSVAFCAHAIMTSDQLVVQDATRDARFSTNPLVTGAPDIRSYAGTVLEPEPGIRIGTLCVIDRTPRIYSSQILEQLGHIGGAVSALLVAHRDRLILQENLVESQRREIAMRHLSETDALTGLMNAACFRIRLQERMKQVSRPAALVLMDADRFKLVNDRYGHAFGDIYLKTLADALKSSFPPGRLIGRLGGDEFGLLFEDQSAEPNCLNAALDQCMSKILNATEKLDKPDLGLVSFGASLFPQHADNYEQLYLFADVALYASKENGRNKATTYSDGLGEKFNLRTLRASFEEARSNGAIQPFYQPKINLNSGEIEGFEVLCRWDHPQRGLLTPNAFEALLNDYHTAPMLTHTILTSVCRDYRHLRELGLHPGNLAVNLTVYDLKDPEFTLDMDHYLVSAGLDWTDLTIEVTETVIMGDIKDQVFRTMKDLRQRGAKIALDDFGTGYGGLQHLKSWPVDILKIDKSFVDDLCEDKRDYAIVKSIISLGQALGLSIVAEGVETIAQASVLRDLGCNTAQGYFFGRPMSFSAVKQFLETHTIKRATG